VVWQIVTLRVHNGIVREALLATQYVYVWCLGAAVTCGSSVG
jgi:hypothetical protein